jgi:dinuclear metal center YbgI/SA1388 family protein
MTIAEVEQYMDSWAPRWTAWERDNVGLQVGDRKRPVRRILVCLDATGEVIHEAIGKKIDLIIAHHPLLFRPPSAIVASDPVGNLVLRLTEHRIALYASHTNLDSTKDGVSFALARALGLAQPRFLQPLKETLAKIVVFVPRDHVDSVASAMSDAGAGMIGEYDSCSFRLEGKGTFRGSSAATPFVGERGRLESVEEVRLEMLAPRARISAIVESMKKVHPYEEVAYDLYPLLNTNPNYGLGVIGALPRPLSLRSFLQKTCRALRAEGIRYSGDLKRRVRRVAVCGGSGSDLLSAAVDAGADVFVTADVRYHTFHSAIDRIALVDAGHWETEQVVLPVIAERLRHFVSSRRDRIQVFITQKNTNPTHIFLS